MKNLFHAIQNWICYRHRSVLNINNAKLSNGQGRGGFAPAQHLPSMCTALGSIPSTTEKEKKKSIWSRRSLISQRYSGETEISYSSYLFAYTSTTSES